MACLRMLQARLERVGTDAAAGGDDEGADGLFQLRTEKLAELQQWPEAVAGWAVLAFLAGRWDEWVRQSGGAGSISGQVLLAGMQAENILTRAYEAMAGLEHISATERGAVIRTGMGLSKRLLAEVSGQDVRAGLAAVLIVAERLTEFAANVGLVDGKPAGG